MAQYASTTINSVTPAIDLMNWVGTQMTDNGWTFVETVSPVATGVTGTVTGCVTSSANSTTITRSGGVNWTTNGLIGYHVYITSGTGAGTKTIITANTSTVITVASWSVQPDNTSVFDIVGTANIYKSPAASNSVGQDFYVALRRNQDHATAVMFLLFEDWDAVNKKARKYAPNAGTGITVNPVDNTVTDATGVLLTSTVLQSNIYCGVRLSQATTYLIDVTINRVILGSSDYAVPPVYAGVFDSLLPTTMDPVPLAVWRIGGDTGSGKSSSIGSSTREPGSPATGTNNFNVQTFWTGTTTTTRSTYAYSLLTDKVNTNVVLPAVGELYRGIECARIWFSSSRSELSRRGVCQGVVTSMSGGVLGDTLTVTMDDTSVRHYTLIQVAASGACHTFIRTS